MVTTPEAPVAAQIQYEPVIGLEVHVQLLTEDEDLLRLLDPVRQSAEHQCLPGVSWPSGRAAGTEPPGRGVRRAGRDGAELRRFTRLRSSRARTTSIPIFPRATRFRSTTSRSPSTATSRFQPPAEARSASVSPACTWKKTPARACMTACPTAPTGPRSISTAPACR